MLQPRARFSLKIRLLLSLTALALLSALTFTTYFAAKTQPNDAGVTLFSQPRSLQPFQLSWTTGKGLNKVFSQHNLAQHWTFLFFGFTHCSTVCPATLTELNQAYQGLHARYPDLQIVFISIDPEHEQAADLERYATSFNKNFIGLRGTAAQVKALQQQFGVLTERDESLDPSAIKHTSSIFLMNPKGQWAALFPYGMRSKQIQANFITVIENTTHV